MKIHHLNCATMHPIWPRVTHGDVVPMLQKLVSHCLLVETDAGLVLIDSGFGLGDCAYPRRLPGVFLKVGRPNLAEEETAIRQVEGLGFRAEDVRHVVVTHLDLDHAGGLPDFPAAQVHVMRAERDAAAAPRGMEKHRYRPEHWAHGPRWVLHEAEGEPWFGFDCVRALAGLPPEILMIPLSGHTRGHAAVAVETGAGWLLHCGDAYFHHHRMDGEGPVPTGLSLFERAAAWNGRQMRANQARLRALAQSGEARLVSAHDPSEFHRCRGEFP